MTCKEKLKEMHPDWDENVINGQTMSYCPFELGINYPPGQACSHSTCKHCWNHEIPKEKGETKVIYAHIPGYNVEEVNAVDVKVEPVIKDSGDRTEFKTGAVRDMHEGKGRMDLLPWAAIMEVSKHCENGARKYGEHNVDKGIPTSSLCDSAARHLAKYLDGWTDEPHLVAAAWNLLWCIQMELKNKEVVNTPWKKKKENTTDTHQECDSGS